MTGYLTCKWGYFFFFHFKFKIFAFENFAEGIRHFSHVCENIPAQFAALVSNKINKETFKLLAAQKGILRRLLDWMIGEFSKNEEAALNVKCR